MKVTSVSLSDLEYRLVRWYSGKRQENVSRMAARLILAEADLFAHENKESLEEWARLQEEPKVSKEIRYDALGVVVDG
jgi:hypothetical protein